MKRIVTKLAVVFVLSLGSATWLVAQSLTADRFLERVSGHPVGDQVERDQSAEVYQALNIASPAEVERVLPSVLQYTRRGNEGDARVYATLFLTAIAIRLDGANLLSSRSEEISVLLLDANPGIQTGAVFIAAYVIGKPATNNQPYLLAMQTAIQKPQTPLEADVNMTLPLLLWGSSNPDALKSVMAFLQRDDLTPTTRSDLVHVLGVVPGVPEAVDQYLVKWLDDPEPHVRAEALVAYADSTTAYHTLAKIRVERMANDPQENPGVRELAKEAIAGKTHLSPNYDVPPLALDPNTGAPAEKPKDQ